MESFTLTRKQMSCLLLAIEGSHALSPLQVLQEAWAESKPPFLSLTLPPIIEKLLKGTERKGFSLQEIAELGQLIEYSNVSVTSMQNWVKREFKPFFNSPKAGKKYSLNQTALLFIIDDMKSNLDLSSIRKLFELVFKEPEDKRDDLVGPLVLYASYTSMFEELDENNDQLLDITGHTKGNLQQDLLTEHVIRETANLAADRLPNLTAKQREAVRNILLIAVISIQTTYFHSLARRYCNATLFLRT